LVTGAQDDLDSLATEKSDGAPKGLTDELAIGLA
jgi:hypothetical protein